MSIFAAHKRANARLQLQFGSDSPNDSIDSDSSDEEAGQGARQRTLAVAPAPAQPCFGAKGDRVFGSLPTRTHGSNIAAATRGDRPSARSAASGRPSLPGPAAPAASSRERRSPDPARRVPQQGRSVRPMVTSEIADEESQSPDELPLPAVVAERPPLRTRSPLPRLPGATPPVRASSKPRSLISAAMAATESVLLAGPDGCGSAAVRGVAGRASARDPALATAHDSSRSRPRCSAGDQVQVRSRQQDGTVCGRARPRPRSPDPAKRPRPQSATARPMEGTGAGRGVGVAGGSSLDPDAEGGLGTAQALLRGFGDSEDESGDVARLWSQSVDHSPARVERQLAQAAPTPDSEPKRRRREAGREATAAGADARRTGRRDGGARSALTAAAAGRLMDDDDALYARHLAQLDALLGSTVPAAAAIMDRMDEHWRRM